MKRDSPVGVFSVIKFRLEVVLVLVANLEVSSIP